MPFTPAQIAIGANYTLETFRKVDPIDQVNYAHETLRWLLANKENSIFGNGFYNEPVYISNDSNYQNYFGADQVTYNERDPVRWAKFTWYNNHEGFWFDEDRLASNGIILVEDGSEATASKAETQLLQNVLKTAYTSSKRGIQEGLALETLLDGTANARAVPGLDYLVSTTPAAGTPGGLAASSAWWQNNVALGINSATAGVLIAAMDSVWDACTRYGGMTPDFIVAGQAFRNAYRTQAGLTINRQIHDSGVQSGGVTMDLAVTDVFYRGIKVIWDPTFEALDAKLGAITYPWTKRCYFLNSRTLKFRPVTGAWMTNRRPRRLPDRYVHYFANTSKYGFSINKRNANGLISIQ